jgi:hypothetical protein
LQGCLDGCFGHKDIGEHINEDVRAEEPALQGGRQLLGVGAEHKTSGEKHDCANEGIDSDTADAQEATAENRNRINNRAEKEEDLEEILQRQMADVEPAIRDSETAEQKSERKENMSGFGTAQEYRGKRQKIRGESRVNQQALNCIFDRHKLILNPPFPGRQICA